MEIYNGTLLKNMLLPDGWGLTHLMYGGWAATEAKTRQHARTAWDKQAMFCIDDEGFYPNPKDRTNFVRPLNEDTDRVNKYYDHMAMMIDAAHNECPLRIGVFCAPSNHGIAFRSSYTMQRAKEVFRKRLGRVKWNRNPGEKRKSIGVFDLQDVIYTICYLPKMYMEKPDHWMTGLVDCQCWVADELLKHGKTPIGTISPFWHAKLERIPDEIMTMQMDKLKNSYPAVSLWSQQRDWQADDQEWVDLYSQYLTYPAT
jgi:hypothetical protein